jgi:hypothetical protein
MTLKWYVYVLIDPRDEMIFYVGKGTGDRMYAHKKMSHNKLIRERFSGIESAGLKVIHEKWIESDDEAFCYAMEKFLIPSIGRGTLCNLRFGGGGTRSGKRKVLGSLRGRKFPKEIQRWEGEGGFIPPRDNGLRGRKLSEKQIRCLHEARDVFHAKGKFKREGNPFFGKQHTEESRRQMSANQKGRSGNRLGAKLSEESKLKMRLAKLGKRRIPFSEEYRRHMSEAKRGERNGMFGKTPWNKVPLN